MAIFDPATFTAAILAGGAGTRIGGRDKGLEPLAGRPLIAHVLTVLRGQAGTIVICANRNRDAYTTYAPVIADVEPGFRGPLAGVASALACCTTPWLLTLPVDCPHPPPNLVPRLHDAVAMARADLAAVFDGTRRQPLFALYRASLAASAAQALREDLPVWRWQERLHAANADFSDNPAAFANLNTLEEFRQWEARASG